MNHTKPDNGAYPHFKYDSSGVPYVDDTVTGLTKREDFAKAAMQGLLANAHYAQKSFELLKEDEDKIDATVARRSVEIADALIAELNKPKA